MNFQFSHSVVSASLRPHESQHARPPCPSQTPGIHPNSCPSISDAIQPSHPLLSPSPSTPNPSQHQSLFQWVNSSHDVAKVLVSALASFLPKKSQGWSPSEWTGWISLQSKGLSRVFSKNCLRTQQSHYQAYTPRKPEGKETRVPQCLSQHCFSSQDMEVT